MIKMHCFDCRTEQEFVPSPEVPSCEQCGHHQESEAHGALEICEMATWHDVEEYNKVAQIARSGGLVVSDSPRYFNS